MAVSASAIRADDVAFDRPLDWRYRQARQAATHGKLLLGPASDSLTRRLTTLLVRRAKCRDDEQRQQLERTPIGRMFAEPLRIANDPTRALASKVETLILASLRTYAISARLKLAKSSVEIYERVWFDVRDRLADDHYVYTTIIRAELHRGAAMDARQRFVQMLVAYRSGIVALDALYPFHFGSERSRQHPRQWLETTVAECDLEMLAWMIEPTYFSLTLSVDERQQILETLHRRLDQVNRTLYPPFVFPGDP